MSPDPERTRNPNRPWSQCGASALGTDMGACTYRSQAGPSTMYAHHLTAEAAADLSPGQGAASGAGPAGATQRFLPTEVGGMVQPREALPSSACPLPAGMNMSPVSRLKKTWAKVKTAKFFILEVSKVVGQPGDTSCPQTQCSSCIPLSFQHQMDPTGNFCNYRTALRGAAHRFLTAHSSREKVGQRLARPSGLLPSLDHLGPGQLCQRPWMLTPRSLGPNPCNSTACVVGSCVSSFAGIQHGALTASPRGSANPPAAPTVRSAPYGVQSAPWGCPPWRAVQSGTAPSSTPPPVLRAPNPHSSTALGCSAMLWSPVPSPLGSL